MPVSAAGEASSRLPPIPGLPHPVPSPAIRVQPAAAFDMPPETRTAEGRPRRVGMEIEFMRLGAGEAAGILASGLGGQVAEEDAHAFRVLGSRLGDLSVELDLRHAHPQRHRGVLPIRLGRRSAALLGRLLGPAVPCELITRPLPLDRLPDLSEAIGLLRHAGAGGPRLPLVATPGLHFNVDAPRLDSGTLAAFLKAYLLLEPWLRRAGGETRPGATLPPRFPKDYVRKAIAPDYRPELPKLADDYLAANPTRDRGLDLLPILLHLDEGRVRRSLPREKIGARPAFHYRLPLARIDDEGWSIAPDWNRWIVVERLACDGARLEGLARDYLGFAGREEDWAERLTAMAA